MVIRVPSGENILHTFSYCLDIIILITKYLSVYTLVQGDLDLLNQDLLI